MPVLAVQSAIFFRPKQRFRTLVCFFEQTKIAKRQFSRYFFRLNAPAAGVCVARVPPREIFSFSLIVSDKINTIFVGQRSALPRIESSDSAVSGLVSEHSDEFFLHLWRQSHLWKINLDSASCACQRLTTNSITIRHAEW